MGPTLFSIYVNSLLIELQSVTISRMAFADDIAFVCYGKRQLEQAISIVRKWCTKMKMELNNSKSGILAIRVDNRTRPIKEPSIG